MLMEQNVLRSNWPISDHDYPAGTLASVEQQHFPSLMSSFHNYSAFPSAPQRFKEESPRTFGSLYAHQSHSTSSNSHNHSQQHHSHHSYPAGSSSSAASTPSSQLPLHHSLSLSLSIPRPAGVASTSGSRKASEEERKAKHREAQRRFVKRKKAEMMQLKQLAVELELQHQLLEVMSERIALERANRALEGDIAMTRDQARHAEHESEIYKREHPPIQLPDLEFTFEW